QRRRVAELLASAIPEDEALLLRDGRLACSLCPQRPVCDTLQTLLLHRAGRKHLDSEWGWPCHPSLGRVSVGVSQRACLGGRVLQAPLLARTRRLARSALLRTAPYSSCCRRDRKGNSRSSEGPSPERLRILRHHLHLRRWVGSWGFWGKSPKMSHKKSPQKSHKISPRIQKKKSPKKFPKNFQNPRKSPNPVSLCPSRGWLQDPAGNWVKDENAEFDSDEEEPPPLPPA
ncbi:SCNM1 protein, partial [Nesospiza acunhae]|nr:SCNM1 protein [Nesospiza acunhae]